MKPFVINKHGRLVFPANFLGELDFSVLESLDQFTAVIGREFEAKAPTGTDILSRVESGSYPGRFELLRDLGQNLFWANRYSITMFDRRPTRWRDLPKRRDDVFLPVLTPWEDSERKVAAVAAAFSELPTTWDADAESRVFDLLFDLFRNKLYHATELPPIKPTVAGSGLPPAECLTRSMKAITSRLRGWKAMTKSSPPISPAPRSSVRARSHGYWLCSAIAQRISASSSGTSSWASMISSRLNTG